MKNNSCEISFLLFLVLNYFFFWQLYLSEIITWQSGWLFHFFLAPAPPYPTLTCSDIFSVPAVRQAAVSYYKIKIRIVLLIILGNVGCIKYTI